MQAGTWRAGLNLLRRHKASTFQTSSPGPQPVYNLEAFAEHVYYVGKDGVLVHNSENYVYTAIRKNADGSADSVAYIGMGTKDRADNIMKRVADELYGGDLTKADENFIFRQVKVGSEYQAIGMEQAFIDAFGGPNHSLIGNSNAWASTSRLWNKVNSFVWCRTTGVSRLRKFKSAYNDVDLYKSTFQ